MKKINLKELKNIINYYNDQKIKIYKQNFNEKWINKLIENDKNITNKFINYDHKNNVNYVLLMFGNYGILYQNKKTKLNKCFGYQIDYHLTKTIYNNEKYVYYVVLKNERSIMDHH